MNKQKITKLVYDLLNELDIELQEDINYIKLADFWVKMINNTYKKYKKLNFKELENLRYYLLQDYLFMEEKENEKNNSF